MDKNRQEGKERLRRLQWRAAERGNPTILIWLGKQILDQKEKTEITQNTNLNVHATEEEIESFTNAVRTRETFTSKT